jgi:hypothetical protein
MNSIKPVLIIKTGATVSKLLAKGEDYEIWIRQGLGLDPDSILAANIAAGEPLPPRDEINSLVITGSPAYYGVFRR